MASLTWLGSELGFEGDWSRPANWTTTGSIAAIPVNGDDVVFGAGAQDVTDSLDQSGVTLNTLTISDQYLGSIGGNGEPLEISGSILTYAGKGDEAWIAGVFPQIDVNDAGPDGGENNALHLSVTCTGKLTINKGGTITLDGAVSSIAGGYSPTLCTVAELIIYSRTGIGPTVIIESGCVITTNRISGGTTTNAADITTVIVEDGTYTQSAGDTTLWQQDRGQGNWTSAGGTITTLECRGGIFDASAESSSKTITDLYAYPGCQAKLNNTAKNIIIGTIYDHTEGVGIIKHDPGRKFQPV